MLGRKGKIDFCLRDYEYFKVTGQLWDEKDEDGKYVHNRATRRAAESVLRGVQKRVTKSL